MGWGDAIIIGLLMSGLLLAIPLAMGICAACGWLLHTVDRLTTRCPGCGQRRMELIGEAYGGPGRWLYLCGACSGRWVWSNHERAWQDASPPDFD